MGPDTTEASGDPSQRAAKHRFKSLFNNRVVTANEPVAPCRHGERTRQQPCRRGEQSRRQPRSCPALRAQPSGVLLERGVHREGGRDNE